MMQDAERKNDVKAIPRRKRVLADSIADKLCPGEAHSSLFYVFRTRIESYILGSRQVGDNSSWTKPMVEIGGKPMLWHIMNIYAKHGYREFLIACGYKGEVIKEYFRNFLVHHSDIFINLRDGSCTVANSSAPDWQIGVIDTGLQTLTGGRLRRLKSLIRDETFMITYGDGLADIDMN